MVTCLVVLLAVRAQSIRPVLPESPVAQKQRLHSPVQGAPAELAAQAIATRRRLKADSIFKNVPWRCVGPEDQGSRIVRLAIPEQKPDALLIGYATSGLWRSDNDGRTATPIFDDQGAFGIGDFAVGPDGQSIWVGTGENNSQRTSYAGNGVYHSPDGGKTWEHKGLPESHHVGRVLLDPKDPQTVWVGVLGHLYSQNPERGVYKTTDGGKTWVHALKIDEWTGVVDMAMDPRDPDVVYACAWERDRRAWDLVESGPGSAIYKTVDGGKNWLKLIFLPSGTALGRPSVAVSPSKPDRVYVFADNHGPDDAYPDERTPGGKLTPQRFVRMGGDDFRALASDVVVAFLRQALGSGTEAEAMAKQVKEGALTQEQVLKLVRAKQPGFFSLERKGAEVWRSDDAGRNWTLTRPDMGDHGGYYWNRVAVHPTNPDELYTTGVLLLRSRDAGRSWKRVAQTEHVDFHDVQFAPGRPNRVYAAHDGGLSLSADSGETWTSVNNLPVGQFTTLALDNKRPYNIIGGLQDNGTLKGPSNYRPGTDDRSRWKLLSGGDGSAIAVDPRGDGDTLYTAYQFGAFLRHDSGGAVAGITPRVAGTTLRWNWIAPITVSPFHPDVVYVGSQMVHRSFDQGRTWSVLSPDLTKNLPNGNVPFSTLTQLTASPFRFEKLYAGADDGSLKMTRDGGQSWLDIDTPAKDRWVTRVVASKHADGRLYVSQNGYRQDDWIALVWRSDDDGRSWRSLAAGLPSEPVNTIREDPELSDVLYVGTDKGVYVSLDGGGTWSTFGMGMPDTPVHDVAIQSRDREIVAASHGRTVFVASLGWVKVALDKKVTGSALTLLDLNAKGGRDSWLYEAVPAYSSEPPPAKTLEFQLWSDRAGDGKVALVDKDGKEVVAKVLKLDRGFNAVSLSLLLAPGVPSAAPVLPSDSTSVLNDPFDHARPKYPPKGDYSLTVTRGNDRVAAKLTIS